MNARAVSSKVERGDLRLRWVCVAVANGARSFSSGQLLVSVVMRERFRRAESASF